MCRRCARGHPKPRYREMMRFAAAGRRLFITFPWSPTRITVGFERSTRLTCNVCWSRFGPRATIQELYYEHSGEADGKRWNPPFSGASGIGIRARGSGGPRAVLVTRAAR